MSVDTSISAPESSSPPQTGLERLLESRAFEKSAALRHLLLYLWQHREEDLSEYAIATEALDRRDNFDPRIDSSVRVQMARLRQRLKEFYDTEGVHDTVRLIIPSGTYRVQLEYRSVPITPNEVHFPPAEKVTETELSSKRSPTTLGPLKRSWWLGVVAVLVIGAVFFTGWRLGSAHQISAERKVGTQPPQFWARLLNSSKPLRIVIPNPVFFTWVQPDGNTLFVRDPRVNTYKELPSSPTLNQMVKLYGTPALGEDYTASSDTRASFRLTSYLGGFGSQVALSSSSDLPPEAADAENLILLGTINTLAPYHGYLDRLDFRLMEHSRGIEDVAPARGAPAHFEAVVESPTRAIIPGIVALIPGKSPGTSVLLIAGYHTSALVSYLTSTQGVDDLEKARRSHGNAEFFQAIVLSDVDGGRPLHNSLATFKPIR